jgi:hypothetical protein
MPKSLRKRTVRITKQQYITREMVIYVPTYKRTDRDLTLQNIPFRWLGRTVIVCGPGEGDFYAERYRTARVVESVLSTIAAKRVWIFRDAHRHKHEKIMVFDDDLMFFVRRMNHGSYRGVDQGESKLWPLYVKQEPTLAKLIRADEDQMDRLLKTMQWALGEYKHIGISQRFMNHTTGQEFTTTAKVTHALGYHVPTVMKHCKLGRVRMFEDLDYTLQLLRAGFDNAIFHWAAVNDPNGFNAPGGESGKREVEDIDNGAKKMAKLHPDLVTVIERKGPKADVQGHYRIAVRWKKALAFDTLKEHSYG